MLNENDHMEATMPFRSSNPKGWPLGHWKWVLLVLAGTIVAALVAACGGGVTQGDYDAVKAQLAAEQQKEAAYQQQLSAMQQQLNNQASQQQQQPQQQAAPPAAQAGVFTLIGAKQMPPPAPKAPVTPSPTPPGYTPPPKPQPPASEYEAVPFAFYVETLATTPTGSSGWASTVSCTPDSVFKRGMRLVWRFEIFDISTGKRITDKDNATVKINLPGAEGPTPRFTQRGGGRIPDAPWMWSAGWEIPADYPLGSLDYTISITSKDGRSYTWKTPAVVSPDGSTDSRVKIIE